MSKLFNLKCGVFLLGSFAVGLPILTLETFFFFLGFTLFLFWAGPLEKGRLRWAALLFCGLLFVQSIAPAPIIQEGHNIYIPPGKSERATFPPYRQLPSVVANILRAEFLRVYPPDSWCSPDIPCWRLTSRPDQTFTFSSDAFWKKTPYSREVATLQFNTLRTFRGGFTNDLDVSGILLSNTNWYDWRDDVLPKRSNMPFFVMYIFPSEAVSGTLCFSGLILWEGAGGKFQRYQAADTLCQTFTSAQVGQRIFGVSVDPELPLAMRFHPPSAWAKWHQFHTILSVLMLMVLLSPFSFRGQAKPITGTFFLFLCAFLYISGSHSLYHFEHLQVLNGGDDPLTYRGFGRIIAYNLYQGKWEAALEGARSVFYFMPGMRYISALESITFGDTELGGLLRMLAMFVGFWLLVKQYFPGWLAPVVFLMFLFSGTLTPTLSGSFLDASAFFDRLGQAGYSESVSYAFFPLGIVSLIRFVQDRTPLPFGAFAGFSFAIAIACRPNLLVPAFMVLAYTGQLLIKRRQGVLLLAIAIGFLPFFLIPLHNYYFGGEFVLLTSAAYIPTNYSVPVSLYWQTFWGVFGMGDGGDFDRILSHLLAWLSPRKWMITVAMLIAACGLLLDRRYTSRVLALAVVGSHLPFLFWTPLWRYTCFPWLLTAIAALVVCYRIALWCGKQWWPAWLSRFFPLSLIVLTR